MYTFEFKIKSMHYKLHIKNPSSHYLYLDLLIDKVDTEILTLQLPVWRPGRYELGNFAKNIKKLEAFDAAGSPLSYRKTSASCWEINTQGSKEVKVTYSYYAADLNAGSTYVDAPQMYVNPCNCLMYVPNKMQQSHSLTLDIPDDYSIATSLPKNHKTLTAASFDELADSPIIAAAGIKQFSFKLQGITFYIHFNGECHPDEERIKKDFNCFIKEQLAFFGSVHFKEYHFLFQIMPQKFHHGVEHTQNTLIAFGPGYHLMHAEVYHEFLGLCCHEFFHTWNIKTIRPTEMFPYDYTKENYARTGFVYEGITTYYGDKLLFTTGIFNEEVYFKTFEERLTKHLHSFGRYNLSVGDSSFDNWLDGYNAGTPYRKTNIYDEGCLVAFMLDVLIAKYSSNKASLQTVMRNLYEQYYKKQKGYTEADFTLCCSEAAGVDLQDFFTNYVYGLEPYEPLLHECAEYVGIELHKQHALAFYERYLGLKAIEHLHHKKVTMVAPHSPAWKAGIAIHDEIIAIDGYLLKNDFAHWVSYFSHKKKACELSVVRNNQLIQTHLPLNHEGDFFYTYKLSLTEEPTTAQKQNYAHWKKSFVV